ncbi:MAG: polysaccharide biosynthesis/export family protein, partial [Kiritimatiellia bacterium]
MIRTSFLAPLFSVCLFLTACSSPDGFERSRSEYEYVPPVMLPTPTPVPAPEETVEESEETTEKRPSFFSRLFSRGGDKEDSATVTRVGDVVLEENEDGEMVEKDTPTDNVYRLKVGDALFVTLSGSGGLNEQIETRVDEEGSIKLRFIGSVKASGLSSTELEREIEAEYTERQ